MTTYASTFISGFQEPVKKLISKFVKGAKILTLLDGLVVYESNADVNRIRQLNFFNNSFVVLHKFEETTEKITFENMIRVAEEYLTTIPKLLGKKDKSFRIIASDENQLVSIDKRILGVLERKIVIASGNKIGLDIYQPDLEFWFLKRREQVGFFMLRITKNSSGKFNKGELRPEMAYILNYLSEPAANDVFMDPFCGYGAIPLERAKNFPFKALVSIDIDRGYFNYTSRIFSKVKASGKILIKQGDFLEHLEEENSVDKVVTDPPWGEYEQVKDIKEFYSNILKEFSRVLRKNGIVVLLTSKKQEFEELLNGFKEFKLLEKYDILVSGKKAGVFKFKK